MSVTCSTPWPGTCPIGNPSADDRAQPPQVLDDVLACQTVVPAGSFLGRRVVEAIEVRQHEPDQRLGGHGSGAVAQVERPEVMQFAALEARPERGDPRG